MNFDIEKSIEVLERTPLTIEALLDGLSKDWIYSVEEGEKWSIHKVVSHLIYGERTTWTPRLEMIMSNFPTKEFEPTDDVEEHFAKMESKSIRELIFQLKYLREINIDIVQAYNISSDDLNSTATHPELGVVTLKELLATWVVHDMAHLSQIARIMAKKFGEDVGPWKDQLGILNQ